ncbi:hypothetical protein BDR04DRAFT_1092407 [Suillus decipiens]|nr:hypothetical protein BDR04DRAFT_1092407 [Suillus decipiens]
MSNNNQSQDFYDNAPMGDVLNTVNCEAGSDVLFDFMTENWGLGMFLYEKFIRDKEPLEELEEAVLLQASGEYFALHPPNEASSGTEDHPGPSQNNSAEIGVLLQALEECLALHPPNEASSATEDHPEPFQNDPTEYGAPDDKQRCGWIDETTNRKCSEVVPAGLHPMLSHLNTAHNVCGPERTTIECKWAVLRSGHESACGVPSQRRNMPRHIAKHLGLRHTCKLCDKHFARSDLLKDHERKDH